VCIKLHGMGHTSALCGVVIILGLVVIVGGEAVLVSPRLRVVLGTLAQSLIVEFYRGIATVSRGV
jgi:hypothetical protein